MPDVLWPADLDPDAPDEEILEVLMRDAGYDRDAVQAILDALRGRAEPL